MPRYKVTIGSNRFRSFTEEAQSKDILVAKLSARFEEEPIIFLDEKFLGRDCQVYETLHSIRAEREGGLPDGDAGLLYNITKALEKARAALCAIPQPFHDGALLPEIDKALADSRALYDNANTDYSF